MNKAIQELKNLQQLLAQEKAEDEKMYNDFISNTSVYQRRGSGKSWYPLNLIETGYGLGDYPYVVVERTKTKGSSHQFSGGKQVSLFLMNNDKVCEDIKGSIAFIDGDKMKVTLFADDLPYWINNGSIGVDLLFDDKSYDEMEKALRQVIETEDPKVQNLRDVLLGCQEESPLKNNHLVTFPELNPSQNLAVQNIVSSKDIAIVHGPPGTGKTTTLVRAVQQLVKEEKHVLVCTPSNAAADLLTEKLADKELNVIRVGNLSRIDESIIEHTLEFSVGSHQRAKEIKKIKKDVAEYRRMASKYKRSFGREEREQRKLLYREAKSMAKEAIDLENYIIDDLLDEAQVIVTTLVGSNNRYLKDKRFKTVVIDEAAQALEPATWIPILKAEKVVLAGDPFQLPPTVKSKKAGKDGLEVTLIEKGIQRLDNITLLKTQYRMNEKIMEFSNKQFYAGELIADETVKNHCIEESPLAVEFIDTAGCGFEEKTPEESRSLINEGEATLLKSHLELMFPFETLPNDYSIGVISPYKAQVLHLNETLGEEMKVNYNLSVNTIDSFQGQERDVIYISMVRSNENMEIGFLKDYRRMNVAMTRAKKKLVIIGDSATLANDRFYNDFLDFVQANDSYRSAWEFIS